MQALATTLALECMTRVRHLGTLCGATILTLLAACDAGCPQDYTLHGDRCIAPKSSTTTGGASGQDTEKGVSGHAAGSDYATPSSGGRGAAMRQEAAQVDDAAATAGRSAGEDGGTTGATDGAAAEPNAGAGGLAHATAGTVGINETAAHAAIGGTGEMMTDRGGAGGSTTRPEGAGGSLSAATGGGSDGGGGPVGSVAGTGGAVASSICGNGALDTAEKCDDSSSSKCASTCDDGDACTIDKLSGSPSMCNVECAHMAVGASSTQADGCCPRGATGAMDPDCRWCAMQTVPSDVATGDYQCLDFESGLPPSAAWVPELKGPQANISASNSPASVHFTLGSGGEAAKLIWTTLGGSRIKSASTAAQIRPSALAGPIDGAVREELLCVVFGSSRTCLSYAYQLSVSSEPHPYTGYLIERLITSGAAYTISCPITALAANSWNAIEMRVDNADVSSVTEVLLGGVSAGRCATGFDDGASASVELGVATPPDSPFVIDAAYTRVVASVHR